jgi:hypothetical protein
MAHGIPSQERSAEMNHGGTETQRKQAESEWTNHGLH